MIRVCTSMLCWDRWDDPNIWRELKSAGVHEIELVPTKVWPNWEGFTPSRAREISTKLQGEGFALPSAQSLAFGVTDISVFGADLPGGALGAMARSHRQNFIEHLQKVFDVGFELGVRFYVFGSPKLRLKGSLQAEEAGEIAQEFFAKVGDLAVEREAVLAIEANATGYGCDWITNTTELEHFVNGLAHPGIGLHLDVGNMKMMNENIERRFDDLLQQAVHFHLSAPFMAAVSRADVEDLKTLLARHRFQYPTRISLEQKYESGAQFLRSLAALSEIRLWGV